MVAIGKGTGPLPKPASWPRDLVVTNGLTLARVERSNEFISKVRNQQPKGAEVNMIWRKRPG